MFLDFIHFTKFTRHTSSPAMLQSMLTTLAVVEAEAPASKATHSLTLSLMGYEADFHSKAVPTSVSGTGVLSGY